MTLKVRSHHQPTDAIDPLWSFSRRACPSVLQRSRSVGVVRPVPGDGLILVIGVGTGAWPERPVIGPEQPFAATHAGSVELGLIGCLLPATLNSRNRPIPLKNSEVPERLTLAEKSTSQIAPGSTIPHSGKGKAPPKTLLKAEVGSFSTE